MLSSAGYTPPSWIPNVRQTDAAETGDITDVYDVTMAGEWNQRCPETFRGICVIGFLSRSDNITQIEIFKNASNVIRGDKKFLQTFRFITVDGSCQRNFAEKFDVESYNLPSMVSYAASRRRYATVKGNFTVVRYCTM